jgi:hypothetical protein
VVNFFLQDYRHIVHPTLTSLSQSVESMLSVQSTVGVQSPAVMPQRTGSDAMLLSRDTATLKTTAPSCDSGVETGGIIEIQEIVNGHTFELGDRDVADGKLSDTFCPKIETTETVISDNTSSSTQKPDDSPADCSCDQQTEQSVDQNRCENSQMCSSELTRPTVVISLEKSTVKDTSVQLEGIGGCRVSSELNRRRWVSTDLLPNVGTTDSQSRRDELTAAATGKLQNRRWTSEFSLNTVTVLNGLSKDANGCNNSELKVDDVSSIVSDGSNVKHSFRLVFISLLVMVCL